MDGILLLARLIRVIAHSMGGIDARIAASSGGHGDDIAAIITLASPHRSYMADMLLGLTGSLDNAAISARVVALVSISEANVATFEAENPNSPTSF